MTESHPTIGNPPTSTAAKEKEMNHNDYIVNKDKLDSHFPLTPPSIKPKLHSNPKNLARQYCNAVRATKTGGHEESVGTQN